MHFLATVYALLSVATALPATSSSASPFEGLFPNVLAESSGHHVVSRAIPTIPDAFNTTWLNSPDSVIHAAIGRGVQNYTCSSNGSAAPVSEGARANLYDVTWLIRGIAEDVRTGNTHPDLISAELQGRIDTVAAYPDPFNTGGLSPVDVFPHLGYKLSGRHYYNPSCFTENCTSPPIPHFDLTPVGLGAANAVKNQSFTAPTNYIPFAVTGTAHSSTLHYNGFWSSAGTIDIPWVSLTAVSKAPWSRVTRTLTRFGAPFSDCAAYQDTSFSVEYAALYLFFR